MTSLIRSLVALAFILGVNGIGLAAEKAAPPNIVVFLVDDMGWQETSVPFYSETTELNRRYRTPNMERLAADGMKFTQAYACSLCSPTRVSLMTGMNAARHRVTNWTLNKNDSHDTPHPKIQPPAWNLNGITTTANIPRTYQVTALPELLRQSGYHTIHVGKAHFGARGTPGEDPRNLGFDENIAGHAAGGPGSYWGEKNYSAAWRTKPADRVWDVPGLEKYYGTDVNLTEALTREAIQSLRTAAKSKQPFFLYMAHYAVHAPWEQDKRFYEKYVAAGLKGNAAILASMIESMDHSLGDILDTLKELQLDQNTIVIFMSDNGSPQALPANLPLRGHKIFPYEGGIREPMIVRWPGVVAAGTTCNDPLIIEDYFPTLLEIAGASTRLKTLQTVDGQSFVPLLKGEKFSVAEREFVWHFPHNYGFTPYSVLRVGAWKLIHHHVTGRLELFNIPNDISESKNLAQEEAERTQKMAAQLTALLKERGAQMPLKKDSGKPYAWADGSEGVVLTPTKNAKAKKG